jgi:hypothetical protein
VINYETALLLTNILSLAAGCQELSGDISGHFAARLWMGCGPSSSRGAVTTQTILSSKFCER